MERGGRTLFRRVELEIREGEKLALVGRNGAGKTTLLRLLSGEEEPTGGTVQRFVPAERWGRLEQQPGVDDDRTTIDYALSGDPAVRRCREKLAISERELRDAADETEAQRMAAERFAAALVAYEEAGGYAKETEARRALQLVGLSPDTWERPFRSLSGGQQTRAGLARAMLPSPEVLVLDEPTNHLDEETLDWLQGWVRAYPGAVLVVSHDREFLDVVADRIVELTEEGTTSYSGNFAAYVRQKETERKTQAALYRKQELEREALERSMRMYRQWYDKASSDAAKAELGAAKPYYAARAAKHTARLRAKEKELERLEGSRVEKPREAETVRVDMRGSGLEAKLLVQAEDVRFRYADRGDGAGGLLFAGGRIDVRQGDKLAVVGPNGAGKTTLLRLLAGELAPAAGRIRRHPELRIGYLSQLLEHLNEEETLQDSLLRVPGMTQTLARTALGRFLFGGDAAFRRIGELSMGERSRAAFLQLLFSGANLLVLDEPTNYLDIETRERMEEALAAYPGAFIIVSHDKYFLRAVSTRVVALPGDGSWRVFEGTYAEYETSGAAACSEDLAERERRLAALRKAMDLAQEPLTDGGIERLNEELAQKKREGRGET